MHLKHRTPNVAPYSLMYASKATLADLVWTLAATNGECQSCDDAREIWRVILTTAKGPQVEAPAREIKAIEHASAEVPR